MMSNLTFPRVCLCLVLTAFLSLPGNGQSFFYPKTSLGVTFDLGIPVQDFRENLDRLGYGGSVNFLLRIRESPLRVGLDVGYMGYENETYAFSSRVGGFWRDYRLQTSVGLLHGHLNMRYMLPLEGKVSPYLDGVAGFKYFIANSQLYEVFGFEYYPVSGYTDQDDWALSYGITLGAEFRLFRSPQMAIDLRVSYLRGSQATYLVRRDPPPSSIDDPLDLYEERTSSTHMLVPRIGIQFDLRSSDNPDQPTGRDRRRRR